MSLEPIRPPLASSLLLSLALASCAGNATSPLGDGGSQRDIGSPHDTTSPRDLASEPDGAPAIDGPSRPGRLLYIGPHPDDEFYLAPILGHTCLDLGWSCTLVVATQGEGGSCNLPGGCDPDLRTVRVQEMKASAAIFSAKLIQLDLGDDGKFEPYAGDVQNVLQAWGARAGGVAALVAQVEQLFQTEQPDVVYTMDPRHGNYCHPTHRAVGALVVQAALDLGDSAPEVRMLEGHAQASGADYGFVPVAPLDPSLTFFDGTTWSPSANAESWSYVLSVLQTHASQFQLTSDERRALLATRDELKRIYWAPLAGAVRDDPRYQDICPPSTF